MSTPSHPPSFILFLYHLLFPWSYETTYLPMHSIHSSLTEWQTKMARLKINQRYKFYICIILGGGRGCFITVSLEKRRIKSRKLACVYGAKKTNNYDLITFIFTVWGMIKFWNKIVTCILVVWHSSGRKTIYLMINVTVNLRPDNSFVLNSAHLVDSENL